MTVDSPAPVDRQIVRALLEHGVTRMFGVMGDANIQIVTSFKQAGGVFVDAVDERGAVAMADGFARFSGSLGVASVTHGPGATNTLTSLVEAVRARTPLVLLTGDTLLPSHPQELDFAGLAALAGSGYVRARNAAHAVTAVDDAVRTALSTHSPVLVNIPLALVDDTVAVQPTRQISEHRPSEPSAKAIDDAIAAIGSAARPLVLVGMGAVQARAGDEVLRLARAIGAPVATTLLAKGFLDGAPENLGLFGTICTAEMAETMKASDIVIAFGASLNRWTTANGELLRGKAVVQIDTSSAALGRHLPITVGILGDARRTAELLSEAVGDRTANGAAFRDAAVRIASTADRFGPTTFDETGPAPIEPVVDMKQFLTRLDGLLPADRQVVTDTGRFMKSVWRLISAGRAIGFTHTANFGSIGLALGIGIGGAVADPTRPTVVFAGDGGAYMAIAELSTAVRHGLPLILVALNDGAYGAEYTRLLQLDLDPQHSLTRWPDLSEVARAVGAASVTVRDLDDLDDLRDDLLAPSAPLLLDVRLDPRSDPNGGAPH